VLTLILARLERNHMSRLTRSKTEISLALGKSKRLINILGTYVERWLLKYPYLATTPLDLSWLAL